MLPEKFRDAATSDFVSLRPDKDFFVGPPYSLILKLLSGFIPIDLIRDFML